MTTSNFFNPRHLSLLLVTFCASFSFAQEKTDSNDIIDLSLEELMNIRIVSASKKEETLFDAPLSSYTITRADIDQSGATSIMEALRLAPGVIVREQANGMYDVHIRGFDNISRSDRVASKTNRLSLVMIDNRPVFNHGSGGTYWESLPIDLNDVERIEIVRGPTSPLFGPNAVTGVINIITRRLGEKEKLASANVQAGTIGTTIANFSFGRKLGEKFSFLATGNFQNRKRVDKDFFDQATDSYVPLDQLYANETERNIQYPYPDNSVKRIGANGYFTYQPSADMKVDLSLSTQLMDYQKVFIKNSLLGGQTTNSAANMAFTYKDLKIRASHLKGYLEDSRTGSVLSLYDYTASDLNAEYDIRIEKKYVITPGLSYQLTSVDDAKAFDPSKPQQIGPYNGKHTITTTAAFLRSDLNFTDKLRMITGLRADKFSSPDKVYLAYEFVATYKVTEKNLIRAAVTRSNNGSFLGTNYLNMPAINYYGNTNVKLVTIDMTEFGFRSKLSNNLHLDIDVFSQNIKNLYAALIKVVGRSATVQYNNIPTTASQLGATVSFNYALNEKLQLKPFVTMQKTETTNSPSSFFDPTSMPVTYSNIEHKYTPSIYGGCYLNFIPTQKLNINFNYYFLGKQTEPTQSSYNEIASKSIVNAKVSYDIMKGLQLYFNARNAFGSSEREFFAADQTKGLYLLGVSYNASK